MNPVVMTIAGSDPCGGSGVQLDLKTFEAHDCHGVTVLTALTIQDSVAVHAVEVLDPDWVGSQARRLFDDFPIAAVKLGMLGNAAVVQAVAGCLRDARRRALTSFPVVCDPVIAASSGATLLDDAGVAVLLDELLPLVTVLTPNAEEAGRLTGLTVRDPTSAAKAGARLRSATNADDVTVLVKGGHFARERGTDVRVDADGAALLSPAAGRFDPTRGTGCLLSASIAAQLARGRSVVAAVDMARAFVAATVERAQHYGAGSALARPEDGRRAVSQREKAVPS